MENYQAELTVDQAQAVSRRPKIGDTIVDEVPPVDMGRIAAQSAKQVILQKVREAERDRQYEEFKDRAGTIINGVVKREEYGNVIVDVGGAKASCAATTRSAAKATATATASAASSRTCAARPRGPADLPVAHRSPSSWPSFSRWKCRKSTTASSRSRPWPAIPAAAPRSP
jgi:N utilization substance protein A